MSRTYDGKENADFLTPLLTTQSFGRRPHPKQPGLAKSLQTPRNFGDSLEAATALESDRSRAETPTRRRITTSQAAKFGREGHPVLLGSVQLFCPSALVFTKPVLPRHPIETSHSLGSEPICAVRSIPPSDTGSHFLQVSQAPALFSAEGRLALLVHAYATAFGYVCAFHNIRVFRPPMKCRCLDL